MVRAMLALVAVSICLAVPVRAHAADDDDDEESIETKFVKGLLGISNRDSIDYRERPPLVVPPNLNKLPAPETNALVNSPSWPKDPELIERKKRQQAQKTQRRKTFEEESRPVTPAELDAPGRKVGAGRIANPTGPQDSASDGARKLLPSELGYKGGLLSRIFTDNTTPERATFTGEPTRSNLTQPPPGYQTPSPSYPYGISPKQEKAKPFDYINNVGTGN
jgi:hypothetical protein